MSQAEGKKGVGALRYIISLIILGVVGTAWFLFYTGDVRAVEVLSNSMEPTISVGDRLIVRKLGTRPPAYGDIIVMDSPDDNGPGLVKRVVGVPGDRIEIRDRVLYRNGMPEPPPHSDRSWHPGLRNAVYELGSDEYFVLGDNRPRSHDSTEFGTVQRQLIHGQVIYRYGPWSKRGALE
jgi:signal peptidase I